MPITGNLPFTRWHQVFQGKRMTASPSSKLIKNGQKLLHGGTISLQSESHPVEFRKVELRELAD